jgi:hypothetical protein
MSKGLGSCQLTISFPSITPTIYPFASTQSDHARLLKVDYTGRIAVDRTSGNVE